jgi:hypothetical protein
MSEESHASWRTPALDGFGEQLGRMELEAASRRSASRRSGRGRAPRVLAGVGVLTAGLAVALVLILAGRHPAPAQADPTGAARAALKAGSFTFQTTAVLSLAGVKTSTVTESGAIDLKAHAYELRVGSQGGRPGFERVLFPDAIYVRATKPGRQFAWTGVGLHPAAVIAPTAGASTGIADPLGLLETLSRSHGSMRVGRQLVDGISTTHYRLHSTLAALLAAQGQRPSATARAGNVTIDVWIDRSNQVLLARRLFALAGSPSGQLMVQTSFAGYGAPVTIRPPAQVDLHGYQPPSQIAEDPLNSKFSSVLGAPLLHSATASVRHRVNERP